MQDNIEENIPFSVKLDTRKISYILHLLHYSDTPTFFKAQEHFQ